MATKIESVLLTLSDKVEKSIKEKNLHLEYPVILDFCRKHGISSYSLHQIIEQELKRRECDSDSKCDTLGFVQVRRQQKVIDSESPATKPIEQKPKSPAPKPIEQKPKRKNDPEKSVPAASPKQSWFKRFLKALGRIVLWAIVILFIAAFIGCIVANNELSDENSSYRARLNDIRWDLYGYNGFQFADWESKNHYDNSTGKLEYEFIVNEGDSLTADCYVDCEGNNNDYLVIYITKGYNRGEELLKLSGRDQFEKISYTFPESGTYTLTIKYRKDFSDSNGEDKARVKNIFIKSQKIENAKYISQQ